MKKPDLPDKPYADRLEEQKLGYAAYADRYDRLLRLVTRDVRYRHLLVRAMQIPVRARVLVLACGTGRDLHPIQERIGNGGSITAVDLTPAMLFQAKEKVRRAGWDNVEFECADASRWHTERRFDAAICSFAMSVIPDFRAALETMLTGVIAGGKIGILDVKRPRSTALLRVAHRFITSYLPEYEEDRPVLDILQKRLLHFDMQEHFFGYMYSAWGRVP